VKCTFATINGLVRPPFAVLLALCAAVGMAQTGRLPSTVHQLLAFAAVGGFMLFAVALNDLDDERIDQFNLRDDPRRLLASGRATRRQVVTIAAGAATVALVAAAALGWRSIGVAGVGLALAAAYSLPPFRLSGRGALTSAMLPLGYVAVPFLIGSFSAGGGVDRRGFVLLTALYLGFMGRLVLKDFRDQYGDALYGKRTMLVRYGRARTCAFSAAFWTAGAIVALSVPGNTPALDVATIVYAIVVLVLLADIARDANGMRDIANIASTAIMGRALVYTMLIQLIIAEHGLSLLEQNAFIFAIAIGPVGMARDCRRAQLPMFDPIPVSAREGGSRDHRQLGEPSQQETATVAPMQLVVEHREPELREPAEQRPEVAHVGPPGVECRRVGVVSRVTVRGRERDDHLRAGRNRTSPISTGSVA
jgi:4-hydroxybenzoate polyprenyltransferase